MMNRKRAQEILLLYRPGTADEQDPSFSEALAFCQQDSELAQWFDNHCEVYFALRQKFRHVTAPAGLQEQIVAERKVHVEAAPSRPFAFAGALIGVALAALCILLLWRSPHEDLSFAGFRERLVSRALRGYAMDLTTTNTALAREHLASSDAPADYEVPSALAKAQFLGCGIIRWQGAPVSMMCFKSGRKLPAGQFNDLWLFVINDDSAPRNRIASAPLFRTVNRASTACWVSNHKVYILVADGNEQFLKEYL